MVFDKIPEKKAPEVRIQGNRSISFSARLLILFQRQTKFRKIFIKSGFIPPYMEFVSLLLQCLVKV